MNRTSSWLQAPAASAAGRMGLFRIMYSLFYLWHLANVEAGLLAGAPARNWRPIYLYRFVLDRPPEWLPGLAESCLAGLLILLLLGLHVRTVTVMVFLIGFLLEGFLESFGKVEHATLFLTFYLPLIMSFSTWGETHSMDAMKRLDETQRGALRADTDWRHIWPMRLVLLLLSFLFLTAGLSKWLAGNWLTETGVVGDLIARTYYRAIVQGLHPNPFAPLILDSPGLSGFLRAFIPAFETCFFLVLFGPGIRRVYLAAAVVFHAVNALLLAVTFTPILVVYGIAVDWEWLLDSGKRRLGIRSGTGWMNPGRTATTVVLTVAVAIAFDWNTTGIGRYLFSLGGSLNWLTIWYLAGPVAAVVLASSIGGLIYRRWGAQNSHP